MQFGSYEPIPNQLAQELIKERVGAGKVKSLDPDA